MVVSSRTSSYSCAKALSLNKLPGFEAPKILFRVWDENSGGFNSISGFKASDTSSLKNLTKAILQRRATRHILGKRDPKGSPFISTTPSLIWAIRKMYKPQPGRALGDVYLAIIDGTTASASSSWWCANDLRSPDWPKYYSGGYEWLIETEIPSPAMIGASISRSSLEKLCSASPYVASLLQLDIISTGKMKEVLGGINGLDYAHLDAAAGLGVGHLAGFVDSSFEHSTIADPLLRAFVTTVLFSFGESCNEYEWMNTEDFTDGILRGLKQGVHYANVLSRPDPPVFVGVSIPPSQQSGDPHSLPSPVTPKSKAASMYPTPLSLKKKGKAARQADEDILSDIFGSDDELLQQVKNEMDNHSDLQHHQKSSLQAAGTNSMDTTAGKYRSYVHDAGVQDNLRDESDDDSDATLDGVVVID